MSFTVDDFHDLVRLVEERPEWRAELRRLVLTDELLALPEQFAELRAQSERQFQALLAAQQRTDERLAELTAAQQRTDERLAQTNERLAELAAAQQRTDERLAQTNEHLAELTAAQQRTDERLAQTNEHLAELAAAQQQTANQVTMLTRTVDTLVDDVGDLKGQSLEILYRQRAAAYLSRIARRIKTLSTDEVAILLDDAVDQGQLAESERDDILLADLIVQGRRRDDGARVYLVVEILVGIGPHDVERAVQRATLLGKLGTPALAVVAGKTITEAATRLVQTQQVWQVTNGSAVLPEST